MADKSRDLYRGLLIPDGDIQRVWEAETTVDEAGERAGVPDTQSDTEMVLEASGHQDDTGLGRSLEVLTIRGGYPEPDGGSFVWKQTAENAVQEYRGWDVPLPVSQFEVVEYDTVDEHNLHLHLVGKTNTDGSDHLFCFSDFASGVAPANLRVQVQRRDDSGWLTGTWPRTISLTKQPYAGLYSYPTAVVLPSGRLLVFYLVYNTDEILSNETLKANVRMSYSDDNAETWQQGSIFCLDDQLPILSQFGASPGTFWPHKMRAAYKDGQILLLIWMREDPNGADKNVIRQYASDDLGTSFVQVSSSLDTDPASRCGFPDITTTATNFVCGWIDAQNKNVRVDVVGSAYEPINWATTLPNWSVDAMRNSTSTPDWKKIEADGDLSLTTDADGIVYLYSFTYPYTSGGVNNLCAGTVYRSAQGGYPDTFFGVGHGFGGGSNSIGYNVGSWYKPRTEDSEAPYIKPIDITAAPHRGRIAIAHRAVGGGGGQQEDPIVVPAKGSFYVDYMGGFTQVCMPSLGNFDRVPLRACFSSTWFPYTIPGNALGGIWTEVATGVPTVSAIVSPGRYHLVTPPGITYFFEDNLNPTGVGYIDTQVDFYVGMIGRFTYEVNNDPSFQRVNVLIAEGSGGGIEVSMKLEAAGITVFDNLSGAILATIVPPFGGINKKIQVLWAIRGTGDPPAAGEFTLWYREWSANEDRTWIEGTSINTLSFGATPADSRIRWGDLDVDDPSDQLWDEFQYSAGSVEDQSGERFNNVGLQLSDGQENPTELFGRGYSTNPIYVDAEARISSTDGPSFEGDVWDINTRHLQGTENMFVEVSPSPAKLWRSKTAVAGATIAFQRNPDGAPAFSGNDLYGIHFQNINFKRAQLEVKIGGWITLADLSFYKEFKFIRVGHTVRPQSDDAGSFYAYYNEFKGLKFEFDPDGQNPQIATILRNSEGMSYEGTVAKPTTIFLDPDTYDEATAPATGTAHIWFRDMTTVIRYGGFGVVNEGIRLNLCLTGTLPLEGYYEAGNIIPGPVAVWGMDYSRERNLTKTPNVDLFTLADGTRHAYKAGKERRRVRFSWAQGVDETELRTEYTLPDSPNYVKASAVGQPVALRQDGPLLMWGLLDRIDGPGLPVVYIPKIDFTDGLDITYDPRQNSRGSFIARTITPIILETVVGAEEKSEVFRVNTVTLEEEV